MKVERAPRSLRAIAACIAAGLVLAPTPSRSAAAARPAKEQAREVRGLQSLGAYSRAADAMRVLRGAVAPDGDLEVTLALFEARSGQLDSAAARLASPLLVKAAHDSMPPARRAEYPWDLGEQWTDGKFGGWHWYVWRARAEVSAARGRWDEALAAARQAVAARPMSGKDWHVLALCAARTGAFAEAEGAAARAATLDPMLPEARYLGGLLAWRSGRQREANALFRQAVALDSSYRDAGLALMRSRLPGARPDTLPSELLSGIRRATLLTSPEQPKIEEFAQMDISATLEHRVDPALEPPAGGRAPVTMMISLLVDASGRAVANDLPWFTESQVPVETVSRLLTPLPEWRFSPAQRHGEAEPVWLAVPVQVP